MKILYQMDVGKAPLQEALASVLERLRREFVLRGSRTASGSQAEEICLEWITREVGALLPTLRIPMERAVTAISGRLLQEAPYWQEIRLERSLRAQFPGVLLRPPRLLAPLSADAFYPAGLEAVSERQGGYWAALYVEERTFLRDFVAQARTELPQQLKELLGKTARESAKALSVKRPAADGTLLQDYLRSEREVFNAEQGEYWRKVSVMAQKQTSDWLRIGAFTTKLAQGVGEKQAEIDAAIGALASGWRLERLVAVDRSILRLAAFEVLMLTGVPTSVAINEAVDLAKKYSTAESGGFVNGVLGALAATLGEKRAMPGSRDAIENDPMEEPVDLPETELLEEDTDGNG